MVCLFGDSEDVVCNAASLVCSNQFAQCMYCWSLQRSSLVKQTSRLIWEKFSCVYVTYNFHNPRNSLGSLCIVNSSKETKGSRTCFESMTYHLLLVFKPIRSLLRLKLILLLREVKSDCRISRIRANFTFKRIIKNNINQRRTMQITFQFSGASTTCEGN